MKFFIILLSMCMSTSAFSPARTRVTPPVTTSLDAVSLPPKGAADDWSTKPLHVRKATTPVKDPKASRTNRMLMRDVVVPPDYSLTWAVGLLGPLIMWYHPCTLPRLVTTLLYKSLSRTWRYSSPSLTNYFVFFNIASVVQHSLHG